MAVLAIGDNVSDCYVDVGQMYPGGNAVNVAVAVARAGGSASYIGVAGTDVCGALLRKSLEAERVDVSRLRARDGHTALAVVAHADGERVFVGVDRGVALFTPDEGDLDRVAAHTIVHTTYCSGLEPLVPQLGERARVSYDFDRHIDDGYADELLDSVWLASFSAAHLDEDACHKLLRWAHERGAAYVLATRGAHGAMLSDGTSVITAAAEPVTVVDTLGAGDACIGRLLHMLDAGESPEAALPAAVRAATAACTYWGGYGHGIPVPDDVRVRAQALNNEPNGTTGSESSTGTGSTIDTTQEER
jgi:fructoselysine 6-kinase